MSMVASDDNATLNAIERDVAWFYAAAVHSATTTGTRPRRESEERFLRRVLRTIEAFRTAVGRLHDIKPHPDEILDLAVILTRALGHWECARAAWNTDPSFTALSVAAAELADAADALEEVIGAAPWFGNNAAPNAPACGTSPRKV